MPRYTVIENKRWANATTGQKASIYGACPVGDGWAIVAAGYTIRDNLNNRVGGFGALDALPNRMDKSTVQGVADMLNAKFA